MKDRKPYHIIPQEDSVNYPGIIFTVSFIMRRRGRLTCPRPFFQRRNRCHLTSPSPIYCLSRNTSSYSIFSQISLNRY